MQSGMHAGLVIETPYCTQQTGVLTRGMTLRAIQTTEAIAAEPGWMASFLASLSKAKDRPHVLDDATIDRAGACRADGLC
jgi:hypothetical protein